PTVGMTYSAHASDAISESCRSASWVSGLRARRPLARRAAAPGVQGGGDEGVPQGVWADLLLHPGTAGDPGARCARRSAGPSAPRPGAGRSAPRAVPREVDRPGGARGERDGYDLAALAQDREGAVPAL